ncbi:TIGR04141 family sporadically distributed protein [Variovorax sp. dw_954]|uniref:TIGR04141 family sporadically distributed protein n=1 Tax=unclassified Variovorax TaxID=663243 RepID=UPI001BD43D11
MSEEKKVNHLSIFLIKQLYANSHQALRTEACAPPVEVAIGGHGAGQLFVRKNPPSPPKWSALFKEFIDPKDLAVPGVAAAFFITINERCFVLAFGQGGRFLLRDDVIEERFGLLCALNAVDPKTFRCVDVQSLNAIESHMRIQSGQETTPDQFGLSVEQDMLKAIVGAPKNPAFGNRMAGSDALSVSVRLDLSDLPYLLDQYRQLFEAELNAEDYQWVNNISTTKSAAVIGVLETALEAKLAAGQFDGVWLSIPEIIDWTMVKGFMYSPHGGGVLHPDINMQGFRDTVAGPITLEVLRSRQVHCADADHKKVFKSWPVFKCLYAEIELNGITHVLNDGKWFSIAKDFVERTSSDYAAIPMSNLKLPEYKGGGEGAYNTEVAALHPNIYDLLDDKKKVMHGGGHGQVEICDLFSIDRELIHVKMYGKSSVLSHLFAQGFVSGQLIQIDSKFREKVRAQLAPTHRELLKIDPKPEHESLTITYAVISDAPGADLHLPFFSRVNPVNTRKVLRGFGFKVELLKIAVNDLYAKTVKIPPKKGKKAA